MKQRIITAAVLLCVLIPVLFLSGTVVFPIAAAIMCVLGVFEMLRCIGTHRVFLISVPAYLLAAGLPLGVILLSGIGEGLTLPTVAPGARSAYLLGVAAAFCVYMFYLFGAAVFCRRSLSFREIAGSFLVTFYVVLTFVSIPMIRLGENGAYYYLLCFIGAWVTDSFAYFTGFFFGKHKLIPEISPKKTVEGAVGGTVFCVAAFLLFGLIVGNLTGSTPNYLVLGLLGLFDAVFAQIGDLFASFVKREYDVKDYGNLFPGHGGVMDRFDSIAATAPLLLIVCTADALLPVQLLL